MVKRIAFITESSTRQSEPMPAYLFYQSPKSIWVNKIIEYMEVREFPERNIFFLSFQQQKIIPFTSIVKPYPKGKEKPTPTTMKSFLEKVMAFIQNSETTFVEFHTAKHIITPLIKNLTLTAIPFRVYGEGAALGQKGKVYEELIAEELNKRKLKEIQHEKWSLIKDIEYFSPHEATILLEKIQSKEKVYGIEEPVQELRFHLKKFKECYRAAVKAKEDAESMLSQADVELVEFIHSCSTPAALFNNLSRFETMKARYGKELAKYIRYLIKKEYEQKAASRIQDSLLRLRITLLK